MRISENWRERERETEGKTEKENYMGVEGTERCTKTMIQQIP